MKIVIIGGTGLVGSRLVARLREHGHESVAASPHTGVNTLTGAGVAEVMTRADTVVDVSNSPSFDEQAVLSFFETSTRNLLTAEVAAGVRHHVALSVIGTDRLLASGYFRAKMAQEKLIESGRVPFTVVRATQFFEFVTAIADAATSGTTVTVPTALVQPIAAADVASALARIAVAPPVNGTVELAGPRQFRLDDLVRRALTTKGDARQVIGDSRARYFGAPLDDRTLLPGEGAQIMPTQLEDWAVAR